MRTALCARMRPSVLLCGALVFGGALCALVAVAGEPEEKAADRKAMQDVWTEVSVPALRPLKVGETMPKSPAYAPDRLKEYAKGGPDSDLRKAVRKSRAAIWAVAVEAGGGPVDALAEVQQLRQAAGLGLSILKDGVRVPTNENQLKTNLVERQREIAKAMGVLTDVYEELEKAGANRNRETKRWQTNYDFIKARLEIQIAFLYEYQSALGQMRRDLPDRGPRTEGWVLESREGLTGDSTGKRLYKSARKTLDDIIADNAGTPWEVLARREKERLIGLEWRAVP